MYDTVKTSALGQILFQGFPPDVKQYLTDNPPADTTVVIFGNQAPEPYTSKPVFATEYLDMYDTVYPAA
jgi:hypothetical protein